MSTVVVSEPKSLTNRDAARHSGVACRRHLHFCCSARLSALARNSSCGKRNFCFGDMTSRVWLAAVFATCLQNIVQLADRKSARSTKVVSNAVTTLSVVASVIGGCRRLQ